MSEKPEALRLADELERDLCEYPCEAVALVLRRLHAEVEQLREQNTALDAACAKLEKENQRLKFEDHLQRDVEEAVDQLRESAKAQGDSLVTTWHEKQAAEAALAKVKTQRDELLEALNRMVCNANAPNLAFARAAIAKCK